MALFSRDFGGLEERGKRDRDKSLVDDIIEKVEERTFKVHLLASALTRIPAEAQLTNKLLLAFKRQNMPTLLADALKSKEEKHGLDKFVVSLGALGVWGNIFQRVKSTITVQTRALSFSARFAMALERYEEFQNAKTKGIELGKGFGVQTYTKGDKEEEEEEKEWWEQMNRDGDTVGMGMDEYDDMMYEKEIDKMMEDEEWENEEQRGNIPRKEAENINIRRFGIQTGNSSRRNADEEGHGRNADEEGQGGLGDLEDNMKRKKEEEEAKKLGLKRKKTDGKDEYTKREMLELIGAFLPRVMEITQYTEASYENRNEATKGMMEIIEFQKEYLMRAKSFETSTRINTRLLYNLTANEVRNVFLNELLATVMDCGMPEELLKVMSRKNMAGCEEMTGIRMLRVKMKSGEGFFARFKKLLEKVEENKRTNRPLFPSSMNVGSSGKGGGDKGDDHERKVCEVWMRDPFMGKHCGRKGCHKAHRFENKAHIRRMSDTYGLMLSDAKMNLILDRQREGTLGKNFSKGKGKKNDKGKKGGFGKGYHHEDWNSGGWNQGTWNNHQWGSSNWGKDWWPGGKKDGKKKGKKDKGKGNWKGDWKGDWNGQGKKGDHNTNNGGTGTTNPVVPPI